MVNDFLIGESGDLVTCKCGVTMVLDEGKPDFTQKDFKGKTIKK